MKLPKTAHYWIAAALGVLYLFAQLVTLQKSLGKGFQIDRHEVMFWQIVSTVYSDIGFIGDILIYVMCALVAHVVLPVLALWVYRAAFSNFIPGRVEKYGLLFVVLVLTLVTMWNRLLYPTSRAFEQIEPLMLQPLSPVLLWGGTLMACVLTLTALAKWAGKFRLPLLVVVLLSVGFALAPLKMNSDRKTEHPDIIILGIDSLRPDFVHAYGFPADDLTPALNSLLDEMVVIEGAITPLARTFVSYMSLLTGKNPNTHGARYNLFPWDHIEQQKSISGSLGDLGYQRILAMDESRFANFPPFLEFDKQVVPRVGGLDFVLGSSYDLAATNILLGIPYVGSWLDYIFGNRAAHRTYVPTHHVRKVRKELRRLSDEYPVFLVSHLCLPHWPYLGGSLWKEDNYHEYKDLEGFEDVPVRYFRSLAAADEQLSEIVSQLKRSGRLKNAVIFVISDHGESFGLRRDMLDDMDSGVPISTFGHGGFVVSMEQNNIVMAAQYYRDGIRQWSPRKEVMDASIIDVAPTIEHIVFGETRGYEGESLLGFIESGDGGLQGRPRFLESGIRSSGVERPDIDERAVADEMAHLYRVMPDLRFEVRPEMVNSQMRIKQRAVIRGGMVVAAMPQAFEGGYGNCWAVLESASKKLSCDVFPSKNLQVRELQEMVCNNYRDDGDFVSDWCQGNSDFSDMIF